VRQRLLNLSRERGEDFNFTLTRYANERLLYRLACSPYRDRFVLKGAGGLPVETGCEQHASPEDRTRDATKGRDDERGLAGPPAALDLR
jgi:hypothetical protein